MDEKVINIKWWELFKPIEGFQCGEGLSNKLTIESEILPIIFVPGIMATPLKNKKGDKVWDPDDAWFMLNNYGRWDVDPAERKALLIGASFDKDYLSVIHDDAAHNKKFADKEDTWRDQRGWGGVSWGSYGPFLEALQQKSYERDWNEPMRHCFETPVHVCGYNWTASNRDSGAALAKYIDEVIQLYKSKGRLCEQVILITHSMGGLDGRSAIKLHGAASKVLGVIHGVQPALGSPAAYWRMKGGFDRPGETPSGEGGFFSFLRNPLKTLKRKPLGTLASWVLGTDGEEVTSLLGNMPGGLELLPNHLYIDNAGKKSWLSFPAADGLSVIELPKADPYEEIYLAKDVFYRLVNPAWLDPGRVENDPFNRQKGPWQKYKEHLNTARQFHADLQTQTHPQTYQFYSEGLNTADRIVFQRHAYDWKNKAKRLLDIIKADFPGRAASSAVTAPLMGFNPITFVVHGVTVAVIKDTDTMVNRGGFRCYANETDLDTSKDNDAALFVMEMAMPPNNPVTLDRLQTGSGGDATVPVSSAALLKALETVSVNKEDESYLVRDHEPIFKTKTAQGIVFIAIENLARYKIRQKLGKT